MFYARTVFVSTTMSRMPADERRTRAARLRAGRIPATGRTPARKEPLSVERIVDTALDLVAAEGYDALTMRRVASALDTGPASLYAHVVNKADLGALLIGRLCTELVLPQPDPKLWRAQMLDLSRQIRDLYLRYPGVSQAALGVIPTDVETLRVSEAMLAILLAGGVAPQTAAWGIDALSLYVSAYCLEMAMWAQTVSNPSEWDVSQRDWISRFEALPDDEFPLTKRYAAELTAGG